MKKHEQISAQIWKVLRWVLRDVILEAESLLQDDLRDKLWFELSEPLGKHLENTLKSNLGDFP